MALVFAAAIACSCFTLSPCDAQTLTVSHAGSTDTLNSSLRDHSYVEFADGSGEADTASEDAVENAMRKPLDCIGWKGVPGCSPENSVPDPSLSLDCDTPVSTGLSGWCECEFSFRVRETGCRHEVFVCAEECARSSVGDASWPEEQAARAELAPTETVVAEFLQYPDFAFEFSRPHIMEALGRNLPFAIFLLCDCEDDVRWGPALAELQRFPEWEARIKGKFVFGFARRDGIER